MKNPVLKTSNGISESLSNLWFRDECSIAKIEDVVEDSKTGAELAVELNKLNLFRKFTLDRETDTKVRLIAIDSLNNISYFEATKEPKVEKEKQLAEAITDALNGSFKSKEFCEAMSREHRYLQNEFTILCLRWLEKCSEMYERGNYDGRNEYSCKTGKMFMDFIK
jgi:IS30 family transposase